MANEHINKVTYFGTDLIDLTSDTVVAGDVLATKIVHLPSGEQTTGTMTNNGAVEATISNLQAYTVPGGYHSGTGTVSIASTEQAKIIPQNIRDGITILGVTGEMSGTEGLVAESLTITPTNSPQTVTPDTSQGYNCFQEVNVNAILYNDTQITAGGKTVYIGIIPPSVSS